MSEEQTITVFCLKHCNSAEARLIHPYDVCANCGDIMTPDSSMSDYTREIDKLVTIAVAEFYEGESF